MVKRKFLKSEKNVFWEAFIIALFIFLIGIMMGVFLEGSRAENIQDLYFESELRLFDLRIQSQLFDSEESDCSYSISENIKFGDKIFEEALLLKDFEDSEELTSSLKLQHKKYDVLRALFWINSIEIKKRCNASYKNLVYLYDYNDVRLDIKARQNTFSKVLGQTKQKYSDNVILIPLAGDNDVLSIDSLMKLYNINVEELPVVLIDEKIKLNNLEEISDIEQYLFLDESNLGNVPSLKIYI
tara:strand:- start:573 stop:1298 length:726 start_codon:yes stop_codon:yes gene_type:complete